MPSPNWIEAHNIGNNFLKPHGYRLSFHNLPKVSYYCQTSNIPGIAVSNPQQPTPFYDVPVVGDKPTRDDLVITFVVDMDLQNYLEIYNWIVGYSFPDDRDQFVKLRESGTHRALSRQNTPFNEENGMYSDATLTVLTNMNNPNLHYFYKDLYPVTLAGLPFNSAQEGGFDYQLATATFKYKSFAVEQVV
jgi:hypothetical protein